MSDLVGRTGAGLGAARSRPEPDAPGPRPRGSLRSTVLWMVSASLVLVSLVGGASGMWGQRRTFEESERILLDTHRKVVERMMAARVEELRQLLDAFVRPEEIQAALAARSAEALDEHARPPFNRLSARSGLTHLAYDDAAGTRLLALHGSTGALRGTLGARALAAERLVSGVDREDDELVLAVAQPVYRHGELIGIVHAGTGLRRVVADLAATLDATGALLAPPPAPPDAVPVQGLALSGATSPALHAAIAALPALPPTTTPAMRTVKHDGGATALSFLPVGGEAQASGVIVLGSDLTRAVASMDQTLLRLVLLIGGTLPAAIAVTALALGRRLAPLREIVGTLDAVASGDLTVAPPAAGAGELGRLADRTHGMAQGLRAMIGRIAGSADALGAASGEIRESLAAVVKGSDGQARLTQETAAAMAQVEAAVAAVKGNVERLLASARTSAEAVAALSARTGDVAESAQRLFAASQETSSAATQIAASAASLDDTAAAFATGFERTSSTVSAMEAALGQIAARTQETAAAAARTAQDAEMGRQAVAGLVADVGEMRELGRQAAESMTRLQEQMGEVSGILQLIDEVAARTNLLALNAAIIAAQAGDHGRGFAVVASEIKALADRTGASVKQISEVVARVQANAAATVERVLASAERLDAGAAAADRARAALDQIRASSTDSEARILEIAAAAGAHAESRRAIRESVASLSGAAAQIGQATGEQRAGGARLQQVAEQLETIAEALRGATQDQVGQGREIAATVKSMADMVQEIDAAAADEERQARGVVSAVDEIDGIATENRASVGRLEAVVERLTERAEALEAEVGRFRR